MTQPGRIVITQSMLFPWVGLLEQFRLATHIVHYDDVQYSKGSFVNRVQVKLPEGQRWMTVPLAQYHFGQRIDELQIDETRAWRQQHLGMLARSFADAPFRDDALALVEQIYAHVYPSVGALSRASMLALVDYFGIGTDRVCMDARSLGVAGSSSERVLAIVELLGGRTYISGHGAARYLAHERFDDAGIAVEYMAYECRPYPQSHGPFTPYVTALDLVAHCGRAGSKMICSQTLSWRKFVDERG